MAGQKTALALDKIRHGAWHLIAQIGQLAYLIYLKFSDR
jgi:hypothetical protein